MCYSNLKVAWSRSPVVETVVGRTLIHLPVAKEQAVELIVDGLSLVTFMCTPHDLKELALGHLWGRQIIDSLRDVHTMGVCDDMSVIAVSLSGVLPGDLGPGGFLTSACGSGGYLDEESLPRDRVSSVLSISGDFLRKCFRDMYRAARQYRKGGGIHSAALIDHTGVLDVREDVGRHNAVDKTLGFCLISGHDPAECGLITTGRLSSDMVLKALATGIGLVATRSIPTSLAVEIAEATGMTLIGRGQRSRPYVYCGVHRYAEQSGS